MEKKAFERAFYQNTAEDELPKLVERGREFFL